MIKFFRQIRYDLMEKNKTGRYFKYAIGEIILVVIGILIALSINNWNSNRIQKQKESLLLSELNNEFKANKIQLEKAGVEQIEMANLCTACHLDNWYSHRAENGKAGRFGVVIGLKG